MDTLSTMDTRERPLVDEKDLISRGRQGDHEAIRVLIQRGNRKLYRLARSVIRDDAEAEDVLQEAYVRAFTNLGGFRGEASFTTWVGRIVINEALGRLRRQRKSRPLDEPMSDFPALANVIPFPNAGPQLDPEAIMARNQVHTLLERAIDELPDGFRTVLVARLVEGLSTEETGELVGIPPETVKTRLHRARRLLRQTMEKHVGPMIGDAFPFAGRRCERLTDAVLARLPEN